MKRFAEKVFQKNLEAEVYKQLQSQPNYHTQYVLNLGRYQNQPFYESAIQIGNMEFQSEKIPTYSERVAQKQAMLNAYKQLTDSNWHFDPKLREGTEKGISMLDLDMYACGKYLTDDTLATLFRDMVRRLSYCNSYKLDRYTTRVLHEDGLTGYIAKLVFNGETFESLGIFLVVFIYLFNLWIYCGKVTIWQR